MTAKETMTLNRRVGAALPFLAYIACIVIANWLVATYPPIHVFLTPFLAPAGVYMAGLTFAFRNFTQQTLGRRWGFAAIGIGALLSATLFQSNVTLGGPLTLPLASGLTFLLSETVDALFWTWLRGRLWWVRAMLVGEVAGQVVDSLVFLILAYGGLDLLAGQIVGKWETIIPVALLMWAVKHRGFLARHTSPKLA